jgi:TPR repeat protein
MIAMKEEARGRRKLECLCAFCREPAPSSEEIIKRIKRLLEVNNAYAFHQLAGYYSKGDRGVPQNFVKANELYLRAGELGCAEAYCSLGYSYDTGRSVEIDKKKAKRYCELAALNGSVNARHNLGCVEGKAGNNTRAFKHFLLAARAGYKDSLDQVKVGFVHGIVTKDEYENALRAYQSRQDLMKSDDRDKARAHINDGVMRV